MLSISFSLSEAADASSWAVSGEADLVWYLEKNGLLANNNVVIAQIDPLLIT